MLLLFAQIPCQSCCTAGAREMFTLLKSVISLSQVALLFVSPLTTQKNGSEAFFKFSTIRTRNLSEDGLK